jgi:hypothetical protein
VITFLEVFTGGKIPSAIGEYHPIKGPIRPILGCDGKSNQGENI